jgi:hypothetical protein
MLAESPFTSPAEHALRTHLPQPTWSTSLSVLQEHARDSFENLLFSLCRFYEITGRYPARVTAVSYTLKQQRFEQLHRAAVRYPAGAFHFVGTPVSLDRCVYCGGGWCCFAAGILTSLGPARG